ncbi:alpha-amylase [Streptomyces sp. M41]|uniref:alpha-amylase n=1 Tax=Streptomyces sp. M41 TaxID=3059412 RepID=UPI00374CC9DA
MHTWMKRAAISAVAVTALCLPFSPPASAVAQDGTLGPAPACVEMHESWRYVTAANHCADTVSVRVVYLDGATGPCVTLPPGAVTTIGAGYSGQHGNAERLAACERP